VIAQNGTQLTTAAGLASYQWLLNNTVINGASGNSYVPAASGAYRVRVTTAAGCADTSNVFNFVLTSVSSGLFEGKIVRMYPNPIGLVAIIDLGQTPLKPVQVQLLTAEGKVVEGWNIRDHRSELNVGDLPEGAYWFRVSNGKNQVVLPVVK
jgi:hypothetical protein